MKRILFFLAVLLNLSVLSGCTISKSFTPLAHEYLVSALGFDMADDKFYITIESVVVNSEDSEAEKRNELLSGKGDSLKSAIKNATDKSTQPLELSHCAVAVIGKSVSDDYFQEICEYIYNEKEITLSIGFVSCENAAGLLSSETLSSVAVGYDIIGMQQTYSRLSGIDFKNRFYEIESVRRKEINAFTLPFFKVKSDSYYIDGITAFKDDLPVMNIDNSLLSVYAIASDTQGTGKIFLENNEYSAESVNTVCHLKNKSLPEIELVVNIKSNFNKKDKALLETEIKNLFEKSQEEKADIFGIGNILSHKESDFFKKIQKNYDEFYSNLSVKVVIK